MVKLDCLKIGFNLTKIGIKTRTPDELSCVLACIEKTGLVQRKLNYVRANPDTLFKEENTGWKTIERN